MKAFTQSQMLQEGAEWCWGQGDAAGDNGTCTGGVALMGAGGAPGAGWDLNPAACSPCQEVQPPQCCSDAALLGSAGPACPVGTLVRMRRAPGHPGEGGRGAPGPPGEDEERPVCPSRADKLQSMCQPSAAAEGEEQGNGLLLAESQLSKIPN